MKSLKFFVGKSQEQVHREIDKERKEMIIKEIKRLENGIVYDEYLWDMRCWYNYKDEKEIREWIEKGCEPNNCGRVVYCMNKLMSKTDSLLNR